MTDAGKEADLAAIKARFEFNYALVASDPSLAADPLVIAAVASCKASYAAFTQAVADADAATGFRVIGAYRHVRRASAAADAAQAALRFAVEQAENKKLNSIVQPPSSATFPEQSEPTDPIIVAEPAITQPPTMENETSEPETTVGPWGIATNFSRAGFVYVVSTVHRKELSGFYQTIILKHSSADWRAGHLANGQTVYRIEVTSQLQSVQEHIDTVRMALSKSEDAWDGTKAYQDDVMNADGRRNECSQEMPWRDKRIRDIVLAADIKYKPGLFARLLSGK